MQGILVIVIVATLVPRTTDLLLAFCSKATAPPERNKRLKRSRCNMQVHLTWLAFRHIASYPASGPAQTRSRSEQLSFHCITPSWHSPGIQPLSFCIWFHLVNRYSVNFDLLLLPSTVVVVIAETVGLVIDDITNPFPIFPHKGLKTAFSSCSTIALLLFSQLA